MKNHLSHQYGCHLKFYSSGNNAHHLETNKN